MRFDCKMLLVERVPAARSVLHEALTGLGYRDIDCAPSLIRALDLVHASTYDLVFAEAARVHDSAFEFVRQVRFDLTHSRQVPIIVTSADSRRQIIEQARDAGANGFLARPFSRAALQLQMLRSLRDARPFIDAPSFCGPDRRRWQDPTYAGPERRRDTGGATLFIA